MIGNFRTPISSSSNSGGGGSSSAPWVRPNEWLSLGTLTEGDQKARMLHAVHDHDANFCALQCTSNYTVDWGDGVIENFPSNVIATHKFTYSNHVGTETVEGYRQTIVTVTPQATFNLTKLDLNVRYPNVNNTYVYQWLDIYLSAPFISTFKVEQSRVLRLLDFIGNNQVAFFGSCFNFCVSLRRVKNIYTANSWYFYLFFGNCYELESVPSGLNISLGTEIAALFENCYSLTEIPFLDTSISPTLNRMFNGCASLKTIPLLNTSNVTNATFAFSNCGSLKSLPLFNFSSVTNMTSICQNSGALKTIPLWNTQNVTTMQDAFKSCFSLESIPLLNTIKVTTFQGFAASCYSLKTLPLFNMVACTSIREICSISGIIEVPLWNTSSVTNFSFAFQVCYSMRKIPALDVTNAVDLSSFCSNGSNGSFAKMSAINIKKTLLISGCLFSRTAIVEIFNNLATVTGQTITISNNWGLTDLTASDRLIATNKGWTIVG
jgi:surface protein